MSFTESTVFNGGSEKSRPRHLGMNSGEGTVENGTAGVSGYEQFRDQRIKENNERLQKLGILDLALKLKPKAATPKRSRVREIRLFRPKSTSPKALF
ncbi:Zinc-finger domain of monoamine-oxidase A repressor R1 [Prunus dulcis]|uniref:Zinc-finger domain of monoamine-oxidase A repressor R1 n=1 Tax=Prunus dulcis TaxID=3755 RepID=A0A4Y1S051_PRUDU|nr:Zinc-finger domain of monoamine-oxidase A repressor R1 [Prunus dulcis]